GGGRASGAARALQATAGRRRRPLLRRDGGRSCVVVRRRRSPLSREGTRRSIPRRGGSLHGATRLSGGAGSPTFVALRRLDAAACRGSYAPEERRRGGRVTHVAGLPIAMRSTLCADDAPF